MYRSNPSSGLCDRGTLDPHRLKRTPKRAIRFPPPGVDDYGSVHVFEQLRRSRRILEYIWIPMYRSLGKVALLPDASRLGDTLRGRGGSTRRGSGGRTQSAADTLGEKYKRPSATQGDAKVLH